MRPRRPREGTPARRQSYNSAGDGSGVVRKEKAASQSEQAHTNVTPVSFDFFNTHRRLRSLRLLALASEKRAADEGNPRLLSFWQRKNIEVAS